MEERRTRNDDKNININVHWPESVMDSLKRMERRQLWITRALHALLQGQQDNAELAAELGTLAQGLDTAQTGLQQEIDKQ